ncbi:MAG: DUF368 domain-containing protein [Peptococcaceae bacterium]|nr:DUF368 domain-containing protein [Peptococcaceae bacterium]
MIWQIFNGVCMALADSVPGVSGGTVAYILGFYERFINALHHFFSGSPRDRRDAMSYLGKLGIGWVVGMVVSMLVLAQLFERNIYFLTSLFLGLTLAAFPFVVNEEKDVIKGHGRNFPFLILGLALVCGMIVFRDVSGDGGAVNFLALAPLQYVYIFISGALAISAMVLPGVSGSTVLLIMGVYLPTVNAINALAHLELGVLPGIITLAVGILCGAAIAVRFLRIALKHHRSKIVYFILGLLIGSLYAISVGPTTLGTGLEALGTDTFSILGFVLGVLILFGLERVKVANKKREALAEK